MCNTHDKLGIMGTEEILLKNVYDLQKQVVVANKRIVALQSTVKELIDITEDIDYYLKGIKIYTKDISDLLNRNFDIETPHNENK
jgi:hypothetical protein